MNGSACLSFLTDEHFVPETSDLSNGHQVRKFLLQNLAAQAQFYPFYHEVSEPEEALPLIATDLHEVLPIDVCVLGMGTDTRIAALFPNADNLEEALGLWAPSVMVVRGHEDGEPRVT